MRKVYQLLVIVLAVAAASCSAVIEIERARGAIGVLRAPAGEKSGAAAAEQLVHDQAVLAIAEGNPERAVAALQALGVPERTARVRIQAAQAASAR